MRRIALVLAALMVAAASVMGGTLPAKAEVNPYITEGTHTVNGRQWRTTCEPYSQTKRCRAEIWSTQVREINGRFVAKNQWAFNNLTYLESPRELWKGNPLGYTNRWTATDGRRWYTECDSPAVGGNGCRSYTESRVIEATQKSGVWSYRWVTKFVFNNLVYFTVPRHPSYYAVTMPDQNLKQCINQSVNKPAGAEITKEAASKITKIDCRQKAIRDIRGLEHFSSLVELDLSKNKVSDLTPLKELKNLRNLFMSENEIRDLKPLGPVSSLAYLDLSDNRIFDVSALKSLNSVYALELGYNKITDLRPLGGLKSLTSLNVSENQLTSLGTLVGFKALVSLDVRDNRLWAGPVNSIDSLASLSKLESLSIRGNGLGDITPLTGLRNLRALDASYNLFTDVSEFSSLKGLTWLNLDTNGITDVAPLQTLTGLTNLSLRGNRVVDVAPLAKLVKLDWLMLAHNRITIVAPLAKLPMLDVLHLWDNPIVDKTSLEPLIAAGVDVRFTDPGGFLPWSLPDPVEES